MIHNILLILTLIITYINAENSLNSNFMSQLDHAVNITTYAVNNIYNAWEVDKYPNFLKSCHMHKVSWEILKLRYQKKIIEAELYKDKPSTFVISFTGRFVNKYDSQVN